MIALLICTVSGIGIGWCLRLMIENSRYGAVLLRQRRQIERWKREDERATTELARARSRWHAAVAEELALYNEVRQKLEMH